MTSSKPIPKIIHQTWKTKEIPEKFAHWQQSVIEHHPDWEYRLWTDEEAHELVATHYPEDLELYDSMPRNIMRADMMRYYIMDQVGGFYMDLDYQFLKPMDPICDQYTLVLPKNRDAGDEGPDRDWEVGNAIFGSIPGHPYWKKVLEEFRIAAPTAEKVGAEPDVEAITGPQFLTRVIHEYPYKEDKGIWLSPRKYFHHRVPEPEEKLSELVTQEIFGFHHCGGTWRLPQKPPSIWKRILNKLKR